MKKILMVCESFTGGVFAYLSQLCNDMCESFDVYLAYSIRKQTPGNYRELLDRRIHLIEIPNFGKGVADVFNDIRVIKQLKAISNEIQPDIIHLHSSIAGGIGRLAFNEKDIPVLYTPHGYAHILMGPGGKSKVYLTMEKILGHTNHITLTCCESEDEEAKKLCKHTAYIETGINLRDLSAALDGIEPVKNERFTVFSLGRICRQKRPELFNRIAELVPEAKFLWIGDGELREQLNAPNVEITGWKPRHEALAIAKGTDVFVLCSYGEAIAMSLLENMYLKKLCLVSDTMGNKSVIRDGVNGYVCDTAEDYAARIRKAMRHFPAELPAAAYADVLETYNTEVMKEKFVRYYEEVAEMRLCPTRWQQIPSGGVQRLTEYLPARERVLALAQVKEQWSFDGRAA